MKTNTLYIASMEPGAGKLLVTMGIMELLTRRLGRVGFFRPVIDVENGRDGDIDLILSRYCPTMKYEDSFGFKAEEVKTYVAGNRLKELLEKLIGRLKELQKSYDFVLCEGLNSLGFLSAFDIDINIEIAKNLGCPFISVINGLNQQADEIEQEINISRDTVHAAGCTHFAVFVNRLLPDVLEQLQTSRTEGQDPPLFFLPEVDELDNPSLADIKKNLNAALVLGRDQDMDRVVKQCKIAAMTMDHFLDYVEDGDLIIAPGDRCDIILASIASLYSPNFQNLAGILLTGGFVPGPNVMRLLEGRALPVPVLGVATDTYTTTRNVDTVPAVITPDNNRKIALALGIFESRVKTEALLERVMISASSVLTPVMFEYSLFERARSIRKHIVLPESSDTRILRAAEILLRRNVVELTLLGDPAKIRAESASLGLNLDGANLVDPAASPWTDDFVNELYTLRKHKNITRDAARDAMSNMSYYGTMMVYKGYADGMVSGAVHTTADTIRPALQFIKAKPGFSVVSSVFFMCLDTRVLVYGDCAVNPDPNAEQLAEIAISSAETAKTFGIEPRVAMLSYSTGASGRGKDVEKVRQATAFVREKRPKLAVDGPIQYDAAIEPSVARTKMPNSDVAGTATVFIFPDLNTGNNTYKAVQRSSGAVAIGPVLQGLKKPVNDLSRGCLVPDIINTVAITAIQAQEADKV